MNIEKVTGILKGCEKPISYDYRYLKKTGDKPLLPLIFVHGFKGYKDWGAFNLVANEFAKSGFFVFKFNLSFNGTTPDHLSEFVDLNAFGENNFSRELADFDNVLDFVSGDLNAQHFLKMENLVVVAHSRGGATSIIKAAEDSRIKKLVTWASVGTIEGRIPQIDLQEFKRTGRIYLPNARTKQHMPIHYQFVVDFQQNKDRFDLLQRAKTIDIPVLLIHGENDLTVPLEESHWLAQAIPNSKIHTIDDGDHTFGAIEPWTSKQLPPQMEEVLDKTISFIKD